MDTAPPDLPLCPLASIPDGGATAVDAELADGLESVILLRDGATVRAYVNVCPHAGRRLDYAPGQFLLQKNSMICAVHGATFHRADGLCVAGPCRGEHLTALPVRVVDGVVVLRAVT